MSDPTQPIELPRRSLLCRLWRYLAQADAREEFDRHEAEIDRRNRELDESIARGCRRTDGRI